MDIANKIFVVTGGGSGMGRELTIQLVKKGAKVIIADIHQKDMDDTSKIAGIDQVSTHIVDISNREEVTNFASDVIDRYGYIDGLINNAGIIQPFIDIKDLDYGQIEKVMNVNFYGTVNMTKAFLPTLLLRPSAHIMNISSMGGFIPFPGQSIYGASKAAVKLFTEGLYAELLNSNVNVTVVFPGAIDTNIMSNSGVQTKEEMDKTKAEAKFKALPAPKAAASMIDAIEKNKFQIRVGKDAKMMHFLYNLNSRRAINFITKQMAKMKDF
ncbi:MAG: SDR family oxidoreductase [Flavobacteriales bacterium]|nr:SDR family oxidoreductase [Flavobacteriales bacterium]